MSETQTLSRDAGPRFDEAVSVAFEDAQQKLLRYHLVRLTVVGLSRDEVPLILDLARQGFAEGDVREQARAILDRPGATELASAIASIVEQSRTGAPVGGRGAVVVGAVIGAYTSIRDAGAGDPAAATTAAVLGAVGGATAAALGRFIQEQVASVGVTEYLRAAEAPD